jgi:LysR family transcriptional regulator, benzoate and cis,cis-muconate-responsive activator of ben and cat genes
VAALEQVLGVTLLERTARRVQLTDAGAALLGDARETLETADRLGRRARMVGRGGLGTVSVAFLWSTLNGYLPPLVAAAAERHPDIELSVSQLRFTEIPDALRRREVDLAITRGTLGTTELSIARLNNEPTVLAIPAGHPLAARDAIAQRELTGQPLVSLARETIPTAYDAQRAQLVREGIVPSAHRTASTPSEALALVAAGLGIYYRMPRSAAISQPGVVYRPLLGIPMATLLVRRPEPPGPAVSAIAELAAALFGDADDASKDAPAALEASAAAT